MKFAVSQPPFGLSAEGAEMTTPKRTRPAPPAVAFSSSASSVTRQPIKQIAPREPSGAQVTHDDAYGNLTRRGNYQRTRDSSFHHRDMGALLPASGEAVMLEEVNEPRESTGVSFAPIARRQELDRNGQMLTGRRSLALTV